MHETVRLLARRRARGVGGCDVLVVRAGPGSVQVAPGPSAPSQPHLPHTYRLLPRVAVPCGWLRMPSMLGMKPQPFQLRS